MAIEIVRPTVPLEEYLQQKLNAVVEKYAPLVALLHKMEIAGIYQFRIGLDRMYKDEIKAIENDSAQFWGRIDVEAAMSKASIWEKPLKAKIYKLLGMKNPEGSAFD